MTPTSPRFSLDKINTMKVLTLFISVSLLISCKTEKTTAEKIRIQAENYYLKTANDPSSYEFVKVENIDTIFSKAFYKKKYEYAQQYLEKISDYPERSQEQLEYAKKFRALGDKYESKALKSEELANGMVTTFEKAKTDLLNFKERYENTEENSILEIKAAIHFRENNEMGGKVYKKFKIFLTDSLQIVAMNKIAE